MSTYGIHNFVASTNLMVISALRSGYGKFEALSAAYEDAFNALHHALEHEEHPHSPHPHHYHPYHYHRFEILMNMAHMYRNEWLTLRAIGMFKLAKHLTFVETEKNGPSRMSVQFADLQWGLGLSYLMHGELSQAYALLRTAVHM
jgi:hypothetical protein